MPRAAGSGSAVTTTTSSSADDHRNLPATSGAALAVRTLVPAIWVGLLPLPHHQGDDDAEDDEDDRDQDGGCTFAHGRGM